MCVYKLTFLPLHTTPTERQQGHQTERGLVHPSAPVSNRTPPIKGQVKSPAPCTGPAFLPWERHTFRNAGPDAIGLPGKAVNRDFPLPPEAKQWSAVSQCGNRTTGQTALCVVTVLSQERGSQNFLRAETNPLLRFHSFCCPATQS